jgi:16S rRNA (cytidine1402-2'-O)-methyltransferase
MALMASQRLKRSNFAFNGYLPIDSKERKRRIVELEQFRLAQQAQSFTETPLPQ